MTKRERTRKDKGADGGATPHASSSKGKKPGVAERPSETAHPLVAAYEGGRLLNELDWRVQQAWLLPAIDLQAAQLHADAVRDILTGLSLNLRPALPATAQGRFHDVFLSKRDEWDRWYRSPGHLSEVESTAQLIQYELSQDADRSPGLLREEMWLDSLRTVKEFAPRLFESVESALDERCQLALQLGRCIDWGIHARAVYRYMCWPERKKNPAPALSWSGFSIHPQGVRPASQPAPPARPAPWVLRAVNEGTGLPEGDWLNHVRHNWDAMRLPHPSEEFPVLEGAASEAEAAGGVVEEIEKLDRLVRDELADMLPVGKVPSNERTRQMTLSEAAKLMGYQGKKAAEQLSAAIADGSVKCEKLSRQRFVFSKNDFPETVWEKLN
jgi:hypothetical protein